MFTAVCDRCEKEFTVKPKQLRKHIVKQDKVTYFVCPHCDKEYIYMVLNKDIEKRRKRLNELYDELQTLSDVEERLVLKKRIDRLKHKTMKEVTKLKKKHERK